MARGYDVHLACAISDCRDRVESTGITVHDLDLGRSDMSPVGALKSIAQIARLLHSLKPDIVHFVTIKPVLLGGIAARLMRCESVVSAISGMGYVFIAKGALARVRRKLVSHLYRVALGSKHVVAIFQNSSDAKLVSAMARLSPDQIEMIEGSGVDLNRFSRSPLPRGEAVLTFAGRLLVDKGLREFVKAACLLRERGLRARFIVAGELDPDNPASVARSELDSWIKDGIVEFAGYVDDLDKLFASSHVVVLPSYREGMPKVLLEAAACGRAVITTNVPGCRDAVDPGKTALLVPDGEVRPLADAMEALIKDRRRCQIMGKAGRLLAERCFGIENVVEAHLRLYSKLLTERQ